MNEENNVIMNMIRKVEKKSSNKLRKGVYKNNA